MDDAVTIRSTTSFTSVKAGDGNDYTAVTVWADTVHAYYLLHAWRDRVVFPELKKKVIEFANAWNAYAVLIEDKGSGQSLLQELDRDTNLPIRAVKVTADKVSRAVGVTAIIEAGMVLLPVSAGWLDDYLEEVSTFPGSRHDDYVDSTTQKPIATRLAMFSEDDDDVAKRSEWRIVERLKLLFRHVDLDYTTLAMVFEFMIGNTDVSIYAQHNARIVQMPNMALLFPVPYDFDYSGLVNAQYAVPAKVLNLTSVLDRAYMGPCRPVAEFETHFEKIRAVRGEITAIVDTVPGLSEGYRKDAKKYLDEFYETIEKPRLTKAAFVDRCNKVGM